MSRTLCKKLLLGTVAQRLRLRFASPFHSSLTDLSSRSSSNPSPVSSSSPALTRMPTRMKRQAAPANHVYGARTREHMPHADTLAKAVDALQTLLASGDPRLLFAKCTSAAPCRGFPARRSPQRPNFSPARGPCCVCVCGNLGLSSRTCDSTAAQSARTPKRELWERFPSFFRGDWSELLRSALPKPQLLARAATRQTSSRAAITVPHN